MKRCHQCLRPRGLSKPFWHTADFCTKRCKTEYDKIRQQEFRVVQFHQWLYARGSPRTAR